MTTDLLLRRIRALTGQVDLEISDLTDSEILEYVADTVLLLTARGVLSELTGYEVGLDNTDVLTYGVLPEPEGLDGHLMATQTSIDLLRATYRGRLDRGELGISWSSGLEAESSISAEKAYKAGIHDLELEMQELKAIKLAPENGARVQ